jgi:hypothetical protein
VSTTTSNAWPQNGHWMLSESSTHKTRPPEARLQVRRVGAPGTDPANLN